MTVPTVITRFRAYQMGQEGSSFSHFADGKFTLIEAKLTDISWKSVDQELLHCGKDTIDVLHITSWDQDHCALTDLEEILSRYKPSTVEYPGYPPHTDAAKACLTVIKNYQSRARSAARVVSCISVNPEYIQGLKSAEELAYRDIVYHPRYIAEGESNNNSTVKVFRKGSFNVASLGDIENANLGAYLRRCKIFKREIDVLLLAHHGADCHTNSKNFLEAVQPRLAICSSNYDNQHDHPRPEVRQRLHELGVPLFTTKTGDVIIMSLAPHATKFRVVNLITNSTEVSSSRDFVSKKSRWLSMNADSIRNVFHPGFKGPR